MGTVAYSGKPYSLGLCYSPDHKHNIWGKQSSYLMSLWLSCTRMVFSRAQLDLQGCFTQHISPSMGHQSGYETQIFSRDLTPSCHAGLEEDGSCMVWRPEQQSLQVLRSHSTLQVVVPASVLCPDSLPVLCPLSSSKCQKCEENYLRRTVIREIQQAAKFQPRLVSILDLLYKPSNYHFIKNRGLSQFFHWGHSCSTFLERS